MKSTHGKPSTRIRSHSILQAKVRIPTPVCELWPHFVASFLRRGSGQWVDSSAQKHLKTGFSCTETSPSEPTQAGLQLPEEINLEQGHLDSNASLECNTIQKTTHSFPKTLNMPSTQTFGSCKPCSKLTMKVAFYNSQMSLSYKSLHVNYVFFSLEQHTEQRKGKKESGLFLGLMIVVVSTESISHRWLLVPCQVSLFYTEGVKPSLSLRWSLAGGSGLLRAGLEIW